MLKELVELDGPLFGEGVPSVSQDDLEKKAMR